MEGPLVGGIVPRLGSVTSDYADHGRSALALITSLAFL